MVNIIDRTFRFLMREKIGKTVEGSLVAKHERVDQWKGNLFRVIIQHYFVLLCPFLLWMLQTFCCPEFHISFYPLNAYRGLLTLRRVLPIVAKNLCEKHKSGAGGKRRGCHKNTKFWASFTKPL